MELFSVISGTCSIMSLLVSLFVASKVLQISNKVEASGDSSVAAGRDISVNGLNE